MKSNTEKSDNRLPWFTIAGIIAVVASVMMLFLTVVQTQRQASDQRTQEANKRAALLQKSVDALRQQVVNDSLAAAQDRKFFELVRELSITPPDSPQRAALLQQLKTFTFVEPTPQQSQTTTPTTSQTPAPSSARAPPSSTTTTSTTRPQSPPPTTCVIVPVLNRQICH